MLHAGRQIEIHALQRVPFLLAERAARAEGLQAIDHDLTGDWIGYRECHIKPDLLLIYRKVGDDMLILARLGSHSELFG